MVEKRITIKFYEGDKQFYWVKEFTSLTKYFIIKKTSGLEYKRV